MKSAAVIRLSSPATHESWAVPVLYEDEHLLALDKPPHLPGSPERDHPQRPNLMRLLHEGLAAGRSWATERSLTYLSNVHRLDAEASGVFLLAKTRPALIVLANHFGSEIPKNTYLALVHGCPPKDTFEVTVPLAADRFRPGVVRVSREGKKSATEFMVRERFAGCALVEACPRTARAHQIRVHLQHAGHPIFGDRAYGGGDLRLSSLKPKYHRPADGIERPLLSSLALHAWRLELPHPVTRSPLFIEAPQPRQFEVALKYLRRYASRPET